MPVILDALVDVLRALLPLEWIRGGRPAENERRLELDALSPEQAARLTRLVRTGSVTALEATAQELSEDGCCPGLAGRLETLADELDLGGLRRLVDVLEAL